MRYYIEWHEHGRQSQIWFKTAQEREDYISQSIPAGVVFRTWESCPSPITSKSDAWEYMCDHIDDPVTTTVTIYLGFSHNVEMRIGNGSMRLYAPYTSKAITCTGWWSARNTFGRMWRTLYAIPYDHDDFRQAWEQFCMEEV